MGNDIQSATSSLNNVSSSISDLNLSINTEELDEKGKEIQNQFKIIDEAIKDIEGVMKGKLASWQSQTKEEYVARLTNMITHMNDMAEAIVSFGNVARIASQSVVEAENEVARMFN